jgi:NitT/TauT family transport system permease protein
MTTTQQLRARGLAHLGLWSAYPGRTHPGRLRWVPAVAGLALVLVAWFAVTAAGAVDPLYLPGPFDVAARMLEQARLGIAWRYLTPTLAAALVGAALALAVALPLGVAVSHSRLLAAVLEPVIAFSQTVPLVAVAPLLVLWIGYGTVPIAVLCAIVAFFPMVTTTIVGLRVLDARVIEHSLLDGAGVGQRLWHIGEMVMGGSGLGTLLTLSREAADTAAVFAVVAWISLAAMTLYYLVQLAERAAVARLQGEDS